MTILGRTQRMGYRMTRRAADGLYGYTSRKTDRWWEATGSRRVRAMLGLHSLRGWFHYFDQSKSRLRALEDAHRGQRCFIICNGPSLNSMDLAPLADEVTFGVNSIFLKFDEMGFRPSYYVAMDDLLIEDRREEINGLSGQGMTRFLPIELAYCIANAPDLIWMNCPDYDGDVGVPSYSKQPDLFLFHGSTVTFICIQLAYYFGCDPVYLIGCDNSYTVPKVTEFDHGHWISEEDDPNHFDPNYFGKGYRWHDPRVDLMSRSYRMARWVFEESGRSLLNATRGGRLEDLQRVDYDSLFV